MVTEKKTTVKKAVAKKTTVKKAVANKTAVKKVAAKTAVPEATAKKASTAKSVSTKKVKTVAGSAPVSREDRFRQIEMEAFLLAERDGFKADPLCYWIAAEKKVLQVTG